MKRFMKTDRSLLLNEAVANIVENLAYKVAQHQGGMITVNHLAPYLPLSLGLIRSCLDNMADGQTVIASEQGGFPIYEFTQAGEANERSHEDASQNCLSCTMNPRSPGQQLCSECLETLERELTRLA
jgi:hypothetical protein